MSGARTRGETLSLDISDVRVKGQVNLDAYRGMMLQTDDVTTTEARKLESMRPERHASARTHGYRRGSALISGSRREVKCACAAANSTGNFRLPRNRILISPGAGCVLAGTAYRARDVASASSKRQLFST